MIATTKLLGTKDIIALVETPQDIEAIDAYWQKTGRIHPEHGANRRYKLVKYGKATGLISALKQSKDPLAASLLCAVIGERQLLSAFPVLFPLVDDPTASVREAAVEALGKLGLKGLLPKSANLLGELAMSKLVNHIEEDNRVQTMLVLALGAVRYSQSLLLLQKLLSHTRPQIRGAAAWALGRCGDKTSKKLLEIAIQDEDSYVRNRAKDALLTLS